MLPTAIVGALLLFFGAIGTGVTTTQASPGEDYNICAIDGPEFVSVGSEYVYAGHTKGPAINRDAYSASVDDGSGDGDIIAVLKDDNTSDFEDAGPTDLVQELEAFDPDDFSTGLNNLLESWGYVFEEDEGIAAESDCFTDNDNDPDNGTTLNDDYVIIVTVVCDEAGEYDVTFANDEDPDDSLSKEVFCTDGPKSGTITASPTSVEIVPSYANVAHSLITVALLDADGNEAFPGDNVVFYTDRCAIETSEVNSDDEYGGPTGARALFGALNPLAPITARDIEQSNIANTGPDGNRQQDEAQTFSTVISGEGATVAAAVLHCDPLHAPGVTPGIANITAVVDVNDPDGGDNDIILRTTVTVVGPPAANGITVTASPATLICGEKATISVDIKDSAGQPVSDHTLVEAVTNWGGVLAGTGGAAGFGAPVAPLASTLAETFGGKTTIYLLTSDTHTGKYEVVITTGGGGGVTGQLYGSYTYGELVTKYKDTVNYLGGLFTTAPISVQVTVECTIPAVVVPSVAAPTTGQGIKPPSTGDAGLASSNGSSWALIAGSAVAALVLAGFVLKTVRNEKD